MKTPVLDKKALLYELISSQQIDTIVLPKVLTEWVALIIIKNIAPPENFFQEPPLQRRVTYCFLWVPPEDCVVCVCVSVSVCDAGVQHLSDVLKNPYCKLETLI